MKNKIRQDKQKPLKMSLEIFCWPLFLYGVSGTAQRKNICIVLGGDRLLKI